MKLEYQVCSLELSKKLKELGVEQESYLHWMIDESNHYIITHNNLASNGVIICSAYTVAELGEMYPESIMSWKNRRWYCGKLVTADFVPTDKYITVVEETEANARAKMLIYLLDNKIVKADNLVTHKLLATCG